MPPSRSAEPAGSGPPSRPVTTCAAVTRASVTPSVSCRELVARTPCVPTSIAISTIGVASAALRQRLAASPVLASSPAGPSERSGAASTATGSPSSQRPSSAVPPASRMPARIENAEACSPLNSSAIAAPPPRAITPMSVRTTPGRPCSIATSRRASAGRTLPARRAAATTASWAMPTPIPSAATSGIQECPGVKPAGTSPWPASRSTSALASGRPARRPSALATSETNSASVAIRRRTWRGVAPRARSTAVSRRRWAITSANVPATTNSATKPAMPPIVPKIATSDSRSLACGSPASASAAWARSSTSSPGPPSPASFAPGLAMTPTALTRPGAPESASAVAAEKNTAVCPRSWLAVPRAMPETR